MAWAALTADEIKTRLTSDELTKLQTYALAPGQADPLPDVLLQVTDEMRGYIAKRNPLGAAGTLPPQVRRAAIAMARWTLLGRIGIGTQGSISQSDSRKKEYEDALALMKDVVKGDFKVEAPDTPGPEATTTQPTAYGSDEQLNF
jgi:hypothetical protein